MAHSTELPGSAPVVPTGLAGYQDGAVVSRTLLKRTGGTVTLFAFDEGQGLSEHTAPFDAIAHVLEGEASITIAGAPLTVRAGEMVLMPAHQPHAVHAPVRFKMLLTMIRSVVCLAALVLSGLVAHARAQDAAAHKAWMDDAADLQDELGEHLAAKAGDKAAATAARIEKLLAQTQDYWAAKRADDIVTIARESRAFANAVAVAARAGQFDRAIDASARMAGRCNACHGLHPEKR